MIILPYYSMLNSSFI